MIGTRNTSERQSNETVAMNVVSRKSNAKGQTGLVNQAKGHPIAMEHGCDSSMLLNLQSSKLYRARRVGYEDRLTATVRCTDKHDRDDHDQSHQSEGNNQIPATNLETDPSFGSVAGSTTQRLYSLSGMPPAACSLLESYVTGTGSPLRNLYCQCKHHHDAIQ